jgi:hypothetical protein
MKKMARGHPFPKSEMSNDKVSNVGRRHQLTYPITNTCGGHLTPGGGGLSGGGGEMNMAFSAIFGRFVFRYFGLRHQAVAPKKIRRFEKIGCQTLN